MPGGACAKGGAARARPAANGCRHGGADRCRRCVLYGIRLLDDSRRRRGRDRIAVRGRGEDGRVHGGGGQFLHDRHGAPAWSLICILTAIGPKEAGLNRC